MKFSQYYLHTKNRPDRAIIKEEWIQKAFDDPIKTEIQKDGRIRKWVKINELDKYLRVILLEDGKTIHNAFLDRRFKGVDNED